MIVTATEFNLLVAVIDSGSDGGEFVEVERCSLNFHELSSWNQTFINWGYAVGEDLHFMVGAIF